jgi:hypothetical protein
VPSSGNDLPKPSGAPDPTWSKYAVNDIWTHGPYVRTIGVVFEVYGRLRWTEGVPEADERLAASLEALTGPDRPPAQHREVTTVEVTRAQGALPTRGD